MMGTEAALPAKVRQVIAARLAQLSPAARSVIELAAVIGRAFTYGVLARATKAAGVKRFVFVSTLGASPDSPVPFMTAKGQTDAYLMASGLPFTILAPTAFMEVWPAMVVGLPIMLGQPVTLMGEARSKNSFVSVADVAAYAVAAVEHPAAMNRVLVISGPQALSYREVVGVYERVLGRSIPVNFVPLGEPLPGLPPTLSPILAGMDFDVIVDSSETAREFGIRQTSLEDMVRRMATSTAR